MASTVGHLRSWMKSIPNFPGHKPGASRLFYGLADSICQERINRKLRQKASSGACASVRVIDEEQFALEQSAFLTD